MSNLKKDLEIIKNKKMKAIPTEAEITNHLRLKKGKVNKYKFISRWMACVHPASKRLKCGFAGIYHDASREAEL